MALAGVALAQVDKCYPGLDCGLPQTPKVGPNSPGNPPPINAVPAEGPVVAQQNCNDPYGALLIAFTGGKVNCSLPSTHCCLENGNYARMVDGSAAPFGSVCTVQLNLFGIPMPVQGLTCRR